MKISKETFEAMIILLYKMEQFEACEQLFLSYKTIFQIQTNELLN